MEELKEYMVDKNDAGIRSGSAEDELNKEKTSSAPTELDNPTFSMQGVSGKVITGTVKVKKAKSAPRAEERPEPVDSVADQDQPEISSGASESSAVDQPEMTSPKTAAPAAAPRPRKISSGAVEAVAPVPETVAAQAVEKAEPEKAAAPASEPIEKVTQAQEQAPAEAAQTSETPTPRKISSGAENAPRPRKISSGTVPPQPTKVAAGDAAEARKPHRRAETSAPQAADAAIPRKPDAETAEAKGPRKLVSGSAPAAGPRKLASGDAPAAPAAAGPRKLASGDAPAAAAPAGPRKLASGETPAGPRKLASGEAPAGPRKLASGEAQTGPRKISSATADDSLAATARAFANRKAESEKNEANKALGERTRFTGTRDNRGPGPRPGPFSPPGGRPPFGGGGGGFDKDKDEDDKKPRSGPRQPRTRKTDVVPDPLLARGADGTKKFGAAKGDQKTRSRDFASTQSSRRGKNFRDEARDDFFSRGRRKGGDSRRDQRREQTSVTHVSLPALLTVKEFAEAISRTSADVIVRLMKNGIMATLNQDLDYDTASIIAEEFGVTTELLKEVELSELLFDDTDDEEANLVTRPPVVVVMGHVDHGKTTLLDVIRSTSVASGESGGITQRIGAYMTELNGRKITFLDTPGHEAFTTMRARGAQATDIAILVVAADDGVMPQTIEAINHAKAAKTEIVVAINKMDKPGANPDRVKQELSKYELIPEEWGGTTVMVPISAKTGEGVSELLEMVLLTADVLDLKADPNKQAKGIIIEAQLDKSRGPVATLLVQRGTLHQGDTIVANTVVGNVRAMKDANGIMNQPAGPSVPVEIIGLPEVPEAGSLFYVVENERVARQFAEQRRIEERQAGFSAGPSITMDNLFSKIAAGKVHEFSIVLKADVVGSVEAMRQSLERLSNEEVRINILHGGAGAINESDLRLAEASGAVVIGFNVRPTNAVAELAKELGVEVKLYTVIYHAIEDIESAMKGMLDPIFKEVVLGHAEIRETYKVSSIGTIGGAYVTDGKITRNSDIRLLRNGIVVLTGKLASLKRFKDDAKEVNQGYECGVSIENYNDIKVGDVIEVFAMEEVERK